MVALLESTDARGIIVAGDLTQDGKRGERADHLGATAGKRRFFFDGVGNHDNGIVEAFNLKTVQRNTRLTTRAEHHYSWDWDDVHFVQLNLFAGDAPGGNHEDRDPKRALTFLKVDLAKAVARTGRPVVLIQHCGFDRFSSGLSKPDEVWWTAEQRNALLDAISRYNVVAIISGHEHLKSEHGTTSWRRTVERCGSGTIDGVRNRCVNLIAGAARGSQDGEGHGVFLDVRMDRCNRMVVTRRGRDGAAIDGQRVTIAFSAPGRAGTGCTTP